MALLRVNTIQDTSGVNGFSITNTTISINGTLTVSDLVVNGVISGSSSYIVPSQSGQGGKFMTTDGSNPSWSALTTRSGIRSMSVFTGNGTWSRPNDCKNIMVTCVGAGGGGFTLFYIEKKNQKKLKKRLSKLLHIPIKFEKEGSKIKKYVTEICLNNFGI